MPMKYIHRQDKGFTDAEILDRNFPNPNMSIKDHRKARHKYYRDKVSAEKNGKAIQLYSKGWVGVLWDAFHNTSDNIYQTE